MQPNTISFPEADPTILAMFAMRREGQLKPVGKMVVDSEKVVYRALESGIEPVAILLTEAHLNRFKQKFPLSNQPLIVASEAAMAETVGHRIHQGIMMLANRPASKQIVPRDRLLILNGISDAQNVGSIIRNAHAFGFNQLIVDQTSCHPYTRRSIRVSMGSVFKIEIGEVQSLESYVAMLAGEGIDVVATGLWPQARPITELPNPKRLAVVIGNEQSGVDPEVASSASARAFIPMAAGIDSLNVAAASAVALFHFRK